LLGREQERIRCECQRPEQRVAAEHVTSVSD
jgi:hypothetical protein